MDLAPTKNRGTTGTFRILLQAVLPRRLKKLPAVASIPVLA